ncbi:ABC transporter ATP-binding protein [Chelativorans salis]|uniref:Sn-glycerol-3-phosphate ABC transporter ATP-binding protein UgpC n=1 Tax=Chelativorans salis TaxID=2978478 RepID=A0ABT2LUG8_9HYPH|nr:sn-glycerol-3-phosphate ABC transporter ATP-binding protein UgpC [Chelativorans sp. EGI FJ00035]MCT7378159.1 sn-glycerol-3-phosphate ABC transporter ATP-binding protein UgpC [Chelativorans sp. EGI FJ00035]
MDNTFVEFRDLRKSYGALEVLHGINLAIGKHAFVVLVGPSGCGKSTLLRMIAGLEAITAGTISIDGRVVNRIHAKDRGIAMVFQSYALYPHMTVRENLSFSLEMAKTPKDVMVARIERAAGILHLDPLLDRFPAQLSGGQRQRVAMGRALVREPALFLFDEPLSNLDAKLRVEMRAEIKALHQRLQSTTIYVTHDQVEAMTMADLVVVMNDGRIEQSGRPLELYDHPATLFVAEFLGSPAMNLLRGTVVSRSPEKAVDVGGGILLPLPEDASVTAGQDVVYGMRPEHLAIGKPGQGIGAKVSLVEPAGWETHLHAEGGGHIFRVISTKRLDVVPGDPVSLVPDAGRVHLFDAASGLRI